MDPSEAIAVIETDLRHLVDSVLSRSIGDNWQDQVFRDEQVETLKHRFEEEARRRAPARVPTSLLAYTHLYELRKIIEQRWDSFSSALGKKRDFVVLMDKVEDYRNAPAHSRELLPHERSMLEGIAGEVRSMVTVYLSQQSPDRKYYPVIESIRDSFGHSTETLDPEEATEMVRADVRLQVGQTVEFECRGWDPQGRELTWRYEAADSVDGGEVKGDSVSFVWKPTENDVGLNCFVGIELLNSGPYHRHTYYDQRILFIYLEVMPPQESL